MKTVFPILAICLALVLPTRDCPAAEPTFHGKTLADWQAQLGKGTSAHRGRAAMALGLGPFGKTAVPALVAVLGDKDRHVRRCAIVALGYRGSDAATAVPALEKALAAAKDKDREPILRSLGWIGEASVPVLIRELHDNLGNSDGFCEAFRDAGKTGILALARSLEDRDRDVRLVAAMVLARQPEENRGPAAVALARALKDREMRPIVQECLKKIGPRGKDALPVLEELLKDRSTRTAAIQGLCSIGKPALPWLRKLLETGSAESRASALEALDDWPVEVLPILLKSLDDPNADVRRQAARTLWRSDCDLGEAFPRLASLLDDRDEVVRHAVAQALRKLEPFDSATLRLLARCLADEAPAVRQEAWEALGREPLDMGRAAPFILPLLRDPRPDVRRGAAALFRGTDAVCPSVVGALCDALRDEDPEVRLEAARRLAGIAPEARQVRLRLASTTIEAIVPALRSRMHVPDERVRLAAAGALCAAGQATPDAVRLLARALVEPPWPPDECHHLAAAGPAAAAALPQLIEALDCAQEGTRTTAAAILAAIGPRASPAVIALARRLDSQSHIAVAAARALVSVGDEGVGPLKDAFERGGTSMRRNIGEALRKDTPAARALTPLLIRVLEVGPSEPRAVSLDALTRLEVRDRAIVPLAMRLLEDDDWAVRSLACRCLGGMGGAAESALPALRLCLLDRDHHVRMAAVHALHEIDRGGKTVLPSLADTLTDPAGIVRGAALRAIGAIGAPARPFLPQVRQALRDRIAWVHQWAVETLVNVGSKEAALEALADLLRDEKGARRVDTLAALWRLTRDRAHLAALVNLLEDDEESTRRAAAHALDEIGPPAREFLPAIEALKKHPSPGVRSTAHWLARVLPLDQREAFIRYGPLGEGKMTVR